MHRETERIVLFEEEREERGGFVYDITFRNWRRRRQILWKMHGEECFPRIVCLGAQFSLAKYSVQLVQCELSLATRTECAVATARCPFRRRNNGLGASAAIRNKLAKSS